MQQPQWCAYCHIRVAPYAPQLLFGKKRYHTDCFKKFRAQLIEKQEARFERPEEVHEVVPLVMPVVE